MHWMTKSLTVVFAGSVFVGAVSAQAPAAAKPDPKQVAAGRALFDSVKCTKCHMAEGKGNAKLVMDAATSKLATLSADDIRKWITTPVAMTAKLEKKPAIPMKKIDLKDAEVDSLIAYLMSIKK